MKKIKKDTKILSLIFLTYLILVFLLFSLENGQQNANINSFENAVWYSIVTLTTVGYGDFYPVTILGKFIGLLLVLGSLGAVGFIFGKITDKFIKMREEKKMGLNGTEFTNHILIIGWDNFSKSVTRQLINAEHKVAIVTSDKNNIDLIYQEFSDKNVFVLFAGLKNIPSLKKVNISHSHLTVVNLKNDTENLILILNIKREYPDTKFLVTLENSELKETFKSAGVTYVLSRNEISSKLIASYIFEPDVADFANDLLTSAKEKGQYDIQQFRVTKENPYLGKSYGETFNDLKSSLNVVLIGIAKNKNGNHKLLKLPSDQVIISENDYLILITSGDKESTVSSLFKIKEGVTR